MRTTLEIVSVLSWVREKYGDEMAKSVGLFFMQDPLLETQFARFVWKSLIRQMDEGE